MDKLALGWSDRLDRSTHRAGPQPVIAQEGEILSRLAQHRIERFAGAGAFHLADAAVDAREIDDARPLALHLLRLGHGLRGAELRGIDEHRPFPGLPVEGPQVVALE